MMDLNPIKAKKALNEIGGWEGKIALN